MTLLGAVRPLTTNSEIALRPAEVVCAPTRLGAARRTRHSFALSLLRRAAANNWRIAVERWALDVSGCGEAVYRVDAEGEVIRFVVFSQVIGEDERSDRVIAERWDVTATLVRGALDEERLAQLRREVPRQEDGRADPDTLVWTRANRSRRFFDRVVADLAAGRQPDPGGLGSSAYVLRSTAYYANGKFGMAQFGDLADCPPIAAPYRAQLLAAWLLREFSCDLVEHLAARVSSRASVLSPAWRRWLGIGNATGLGMVPFIINHPPMFSAWCLARETALAAARNTPEHQASAQLPSLRHRLGAAVAYFAQRRNETYEPFVPAEQLAVELRQTCRWVETPLGGPRPWDALWRRAEEALGPEAQEVLLSCLVDGSDALDRAIEESLYVTDEIPLPTGTAADLLAKIESRYSWALELAGSDDARTNFWYYSRHSEEPRRAPRVESAQTVAMAVDVPHIVASLADALHSVERGAGLAALLLERPEHRQAASRVLATAGLAYPEPMVNLEAGSFLPLELQRFQLAMYGAENFVPQSHEWLCVTLLQGAPGREDLAACPSPQSPLFPTMPC